jgi:hypothetical protein
MKRRKTLPGIKAINDQQTLKSPSLLERGWGEVKD